MAGPEKGKGKAKKCFSPPPPPYPSQSFSINSSHHEPPRTRTSDQIEDTNVQMAIHRSRADMKVKNRAGRDNGGESSRAAPSRSYVEEEDVEMMGDEGEGMNGEGEDEDDFGEDLNGDDETEVLAKRKKSKGTNPNGRYVGRQLADYDLPYDQLCLLNLVHELHAAGYDCTTLWDNVAWRMSNDPNKSGSSITQHLEWLRIVLFNFGYIVPPHNQRNNCPAASRQYRGVIRTEVCDEYKEGWRFVNWNEHIHPTHDTISVRFPGDSHDTVFRRQEQDYNIQPNCPFQTSKALEGKKKWYFGENPQKHQDQGFGGETNLRVRHGFGAGSNEMNSSEEGEDSGSDSDSDRPSGRIPSNGFTKEQLGDAENPHARLKEKGYNGFRKATALHRRKKYSGLVTQFGRAPPEMPKNTYSRKGQAEQATKTTATKKTAAKRKSNTQAGSDHESGCSDVPNDEMVPRNFVQSTLIKSQGGPDGDDDDEESEEENNTRMSQKVSPPNNQTPAGKKSQSTKKVFLRLRLSQGKETNGHHRTTKLRKVHQYSKEQLQALQELRKLQAKKTTTLDRGGAQTRTSGTKATTSGTKGGKKPTGIAKTRSNGVSRNGRTPRTSAPTSRHGNAPRTGGTSRGSRGRGTTPSARPTHPALLQVAAMTHGYQRPPMDHDFAANQNHPRGMINPQNAIYPQRQTGCPSALQQGQSPPNYATMDENELSPTAVPLYQPFSQHGNRQETYSRQRGHGSASANFGNFPYSGNNSNPVFPGGHHPSSDGLGFNGTMNNAALQGFQDQSPDSSAYMVPPYAASLVPQHVISQAGPPNSQPNGTRGANMNPIYRSDYGQVQHHVYDPNRLGVGYIPASMKQAQHRGSGHGHGSQFDRSARPAAAANMSSEQSINPQSGYVNDLAAQPAGINMRSEGYAYSQYAHCNGRPGPPATNHDPMQFANGGTAGSPSGHQHGLIFPIQENQGFEELDAGMK